MMNVDEDALACDLAETYAIYDYRRLPPTRVAVFAYGLGNDSRIKRKLTGSKCSTEELLLATIADRLSLLVWFNSEDGHKGRNRPKSIVEMLTDGNQHDDRVRGFASAEDFDRTIKKLKEGG